MLEYKKRNPLLMTKFGKSEKTELSGLLFWNIRF
jgi:hypothetical protein